ncbi:glycoside hydrolase superfamily [Fimicolochytrium jonesii]|uniref:glycoside hydrolase superfamily n=1 Tax=Fimicolochytrium jonesii TaxID=1396493 RepID=UPI0022FED649|nr:glycoside hydrolase superfamily [Fimicolochytrium jonesii]KAI8818576.1 glycoside hydrolase superfamily [Fimicolochytrium jonesii]
MPRKKVTPKKGFLESRSIGSCFLMGLGVGICLYTFLSLCVGLVIAAPAAPSKAANGDYNWAIGAQYTKGQIVDYQANRYQVLTTHVSQTDWYPGCCAAIWKLVGPVSGGTAPAAAAKPTAVSVGAGAAVSGGVVAGTTPPSTSASASTGTWPSKVYAPYVDVMLWPTLDVSAVATQIGVKYFTLAFVTAAADAAHTPAWGGITPVSSGFYKDIVQKLRAAGGDVIISFGGANGQELAQVITDEKALLATYQSIVTAYQLTWADFDIEGAGLVDKAAVDRRNRVLATLKKNNPKLKIGYTLPALPNGLTAEGVALLQSAAKAGLAVDVINIMAMDYGAGAAPNGATGMGGYAISAAKATLTQAHLAGLLTTKIGVTPMLGQNDVPGEIFRVADAVELVTWAKSTDWIASLGAWSVNRDKAKTGPLYASTQIVQKDYEFSAVLNGVTTVKTSTQKEVYGEQQPAAEAPVPVPEAATGSTGRYFAPYVDVLLWPTLDVSTVAQTTGHKFYTLAFILADPAGDPAWGGVTKIATGFYKDIIDKLRALGGDVIISLGGATGTELALQVTDPKALQAKYQSVIDTYGVSWLDFDIEGATLPNTAANDRRNQAIAGLQKANPGVKISYTLPAMPDGVDAYSIALFASAAKMGTKIDVVNIMAMDYGGGAAPNGATGMGGYAISAAQATYKQVQAAGFTATQIGITPMIGQNDVAGEVFRLADAAQLSTWASSTPWVGRIAMWSVNRDTSKKGALYASSQVSQADLDFVNTFKGFQSGVITSVPASTEGGTENSADDAPTKTPKAPKAKKTKKPKKVTKVTKATRDEPEADDEETEETDDEEVDEDGSVGGIHLPSVAQIVGTVGGVIADVKDAVKNVPETATGAVKDAAADAKDALKGAAESAKDAVKLAASTGSDNAARLLQELPEPLKRWTYLNAPLPPARGSPGHSAGVPDPSLIITAEHAKRSLSTKRNTLGDSLTWSTRTLAPYVDVTAWPTFDIVGAAKSSGLRHFALGFIIADKQGDPSWGGYYKVSSSFLKKDIQTLRNDHDGDVIVSFGGAAGKELALKAASQAALVTTYQSVIDALKITWADFDIEGKALANKTSVDTRNKALVKIKAKNPTLVISYTLPVEPTGLTTEGKYVLTSAHKAGLKIDVVNLMVMDWDPAHCKNNACKTVMAQHAISAAQATYKLLTSEFPAGSVPKIGLTPMIGVNDLADEIFTLNNAQELINFASGGSGKDIGAGAGAGGDWLAFLGFWSLNRDNSAKSNSMDTSSGIIQGDWAFSHILVAFAK